MFFACISEKNRVAMAEKQTQSRYPNTIQVNGDKLENISLCPCSYVPTEKMSICSTQHVRVLTDREFGQTTNEIK